MSFSSIPIKTSIPTPGTTPASADAFTYSSIDGVNTLEISGKATVGSGTLILVRYFADLDEWRPWHEDRKISVDSGVLGGFFSAVYPVPKGDEAFVLYDSASAITATVKARRTSSPDEAVAASSGGTIAANPNVPSHTPAKSFVNASASSTVLLAANSSRKSASFFNNSSADLYLDETGGTATTTTGFTVILKANGGYYELPAGANGSLTTGAITGIWSSASTSGVAVCERS